MAVEKEQNLRRLEDRARRAKQPGHVAEDGFPVSPCECRFDPRPNARYTDQTGLAINGFFYVGGPGGGPPVGP